MWICGRALKWLQQRWPEFGLQIRSHFLHDSDGEPLDRHAVLVGDPDEEEAPGYGEIHIVPAYRYLEPVVTQWGGKRKRGKVGFSSPKQTATRWRAWTLHSLRHEQRDSIKHIVIPT